MKNPYSRNISRNIIFWINPNILERSLKNFHLKCFPSKSKVIIMPSEENFSCWLFWLAGNDFTIIYQRNPGISQIYRIHVKYTRIYKIVEMRREIPKVQHFQENFPTQINHKACRQITDCVLAVFQCWFVGTFYYHWCCILDSVFV